MEKQEKCGASKCTPGELIEKVVCKESDLKENEMMVFDWESEIQILVVKQKGQIYAIGNKCPHVGAPLHTGALGNGHVRCPWHGACFNLATGDIEDFPALDSVPTLKVSVEADGGVKLKGIKKHLENGKRIRCKATVASSVSDRRTFLVVGGGPASQVCAETLRENGFQGKIIIVSKENHLPYTRVLLSKHMEADPHHLRPPSFYKKYDIETNLGVELMKLHTNEKAIEVSSGKKIQYDCLFLATGLSPRTLTIPGSDLKNIFTLRNIEDANNINKESKNRDVVIIGSSFIGMECAACCIEIAKSVTVVSLDSLPFEIVLGSVLGTRFMKLFEEKGVKFCMKASVAEILPNKSDSSCVGFIKLENEKTLEADVVVVGIGTVPGTQYLENSGVNTDNGFIVVNEFCETSIPGIFAGGDVVIAPVLGRTGNITHWQLAHYHGRIAGLNMVGKRERINTVPFFNTMFFGLGIRYAGFAPKYDDVVIHGNVDELKFIAYYCDGNSVLAIASLQNDPIACHFAELLSLGRSISKVDIQNDATAWTQTLL